MSMNLRRTAMLLQAICPPKLELAALGGIRFCLGAVKPNGNKAFMVDTLAQVKRLEAQGFSRKQAGVITSIAMEVLNDSLQNVHLMQKWSKPLQDLKLANFKLEVQSFQEHRLSSLQHEIEKLNVDMAKIHSDLRSCIHKKLAKHELEIMKTTTKLDWDINGLRDQLEATKLEVVKYCVGTIFSIGLALAWLKM